MILPFANRTKNSAKDLEQNRGLQRLVTCNVWRHYKIGSNGTPRPARGAVLPYIDSLSKKLDSTVVFKTQHGYTDGNTVGPVDFEGTSCVTQKSKEVEQFRPRY